MKRVWCWMFGPRPYQYGSKRYSAEADMQKAIWKDAMTP